MAKGKPAGKATSSVVAGFDLEELRRAYDGRFSDISAAIVVTVPPTGTIVAVNPEAEDLTGYEAGELRAMSFLDIFSDEYRQRVGAIFHGPQAGKQEFGQLFEHNVIVQKRSRRKIIVDMGFRLSHSGGQPVYVFTLHDITDLKNSENRIKQANDYITDILDSMREYVFVVDAEDRIKTVNRRAVEVLGRSEEELVGVDFRSLLAGGCDGAASPAGTAGKGWVGRLDKGGEFEAVLCSRSGDATPVLLSTASLHAQTGGGRLFVVVALDLTERKKAERLIAGQQMMLVQASKLTALGEMASAIAHEINNPLQVIQGRCDLLAVPAVANKPAAISDAMGVIEKMTQRIESIVKGLKDFSRDHGTTPMTGIPLAEIISETLLLCQKRIDDSGIRLVLPDIPATALVTCRPTQISQVILNLLNNAFDAARDDASQDRSILVEFAESGQTLEIAVVNSGKRIDAAIVDRIFEPFFTTKAIGKGTGLGLSISRMIAEDHGGRLYCDLQAERTRFVLALPKTAAHTRGKRSRLPSAG